MAASAKDCRIAVGFITHPKIVKLRRRLGADGVLSLIALWAWTAGNKPSGSLAGVSDEDLEICAAWPGAPGSLIAELTELRLLDGEEGERSIHDWQEHNSWAAGAEMRSQKARKAALAKHGSDAESMQGANTEQAPSVHEACLEQQNNCTEHAQPPVSSCPLPFPSFPLPTNSLPLPGIEPSLSAQGSDEAAAIRKTMWAKGVSLLTAAGTKEGSARSHLGKLASEYGDATLLQAIEAAERNPPANPSAWLVKACEANAKPTSRASTASRLYLGAQDYLA